ncbi:hypothetical protein [Cellulomonas shaoxiangyii]|uniref:Uncharacterized protein n=1 Tax=Cellulomonas shaoxiangyii TaxID=2566013 RepID=A0A4P7SK10_9CELL|nr:hypothetical protein [Cellulomonas shaoxiangyii]QCB94512.1 hypothetical protein E5225_14065 [Cellulomonas shaoxiangyii]TGY86093.1 hypothetical protein E5226_03790 [Cellulomonas shaoxiangyii]
MCFPTACTTCGKTTWSGCGQHVEDVRRAVPAAQWCPGHADAPGADASASGGFWSRLLRR